MAENETGAGGQDTSASAYPGSAEGVAPDAPRRRITDITARVETIVDAAEDVARDIRAQAESDALLYAQAKREEADRIVETRRHELADMHSAMTRQAQVVQAEIAALAEQISSFLVTQATQASPGLSDSPLASGAEIAASPGADPVFSEPPEPSYSPPEPTYSAPVEPAFSMPVQPAEPAFPAPSESQTSESSQQPAWTDRPLPDEPAPSLEASLADDPLPADPVVDPVADPNLSPTSEPLGSTPPPGGIAEEATAPTAYEGTGEAETQGAETARPRFSNPFRRSSNVTEETAEPAVPDTDPELPTEASPPDSGAFGGDELAVADDPSAVTSGTGSRRDPDAAILMATQMAVAGSSRAEVRTTLLREFDMADAESAILEVLGPEST